MIRWQHGMGSAVLLKLFWSTQASTNLPSCSSGKRPTRNQRTGGCSAIVPQESFAAEVVKGHAVDLHSQICSVHETVNIGWSGPYESL